MFVIKEHRYYCDSISSCDFVSYSLWPNFSDFVNSGVQGYIELFKPLTLWDLSTLFPSSVFHFESASYHTRTVCYGYIQEVSNCFCSRNVSLLSY